MMRLSFSTRDVQRPSFSALCRTARDFGVVGIEIYDALEEKRTHQDSVLRDEVSSDARIQMANNGCLICAVRFPLPVDDGEVTSSDIERYVRLACRADIENVIFHLAHETDVRCLYEKFRNAIRSAELNGVNILFETEGPMARTGRFLDLANSFCSPAIGAAWNIRQTYFMGEESAETTMKTLGAYIRYVRVGDRKDGVDVLLGEGDLPWKDFENALLSLNYEGYCLIDWNDEVRDPDIVLAHFVSYVGSSARGPSAGDLHFNRSRTGTFPWRKYEVIEETFGGVLDRMAMTYPDQLAVKYPTLEYTRTYSQFRDDVDRVAAAFIALGVKPGYHVAIWATNVPEWFLSFWAATRIGAVLVTVNTAYKAHELEYLLRQSDTHTLVMIDHLKDISYSRTVNGICPELKSNGRGEPLFSKALPFLRHVVTVGFEMDGCLSWGQMLEKGLDVPLEEVRRRASMVKPEDVCNMQYTSGTTGFPKGVMLTHRNIVNNGKTIGDRMDLSTADRMMVQVPMFHCFGMVLTMTSTMTHGGTIYPIPYFSPKSSLECIHRERITCFNGVPTMFIAMFANEDFPKTDFSHVRTGIMAGANCPPDLMRRASVEMNMREIVSVYGQTEASPGCTMGEVDEDLEHRVETVGSSFPGIECRIIDPETGMDLSDGQSGEFVVRGFNVMKGYYKMPEATAKAIDSDGWLHSGDICMRTADGYYKVTGRLKDMIIRGGENIYPREIEEFYLTNPKVRDIQVVGVDDPSYGEEACAWVILHDGQTSDEEEMKAYGYASMARHKVPRHFLFTDKFPMNAAGKILKYRLKEQAGALLKTWEHRAST